MCVLLGKKSLRDITMASQPTLSSMLPSLSAADGGARPTRNLRLTKFDMSRIRDDSVVVFIGKRNTGKSFLIKDLLWHKRGIPIGTVISGTESANSFYSQIVPSILIHEEFNPGIIANVLKRQEMLTKQINKAKQAGGSSAIDRRTFIIMDDCMFDNKWVSDKYIRSLFMNGRHYGLLYILALQYVMGIPPVLRGNVDYVFILRENQIENRRRIFQQFAGIFPTFEMFCQIMDQCTENYECLVIHNGSHSNKLEDCVFWYKAEPRPDFKIGPRELWIKSAEYDRQKELAEAAGETGQALTSADYARKSTTPLIQVKKY
jgi:hypothetical protein